MNAMLKYITIVCTLAMLVSFCAIANAETEGNNTAEENKVHDEANDLDPAPWDHIVSVVAGNGFTVGLRSDGRVAYAGDNNSEDIQKIANWREIIRIEVLDKGDLSYIMGYEKDGGIRLASVSLPYWEDHFQGRKWTEEDLSDWKSIVQLIIVDNFCAGLRNDGTVVAMGDSLSEADLRNISEWRDIVQIVYHYGASNVFIGLKSDGTIECTDWEQMADMWGLDEEWNDIKQIQIGYTPYRNTKPIGIKKDGTLVGLINENVKYDYDIEYSRFYEPDVTEWVGITDLYHTEGCLYALRNDGRICVFTYDSVVDMDFGADIFEYSTWTDIIQFDCDLGRSGPPAALREDGTVVTDPDLYDLRHNLSGRDTTGWQDVKKIIGCGSLLIGIKKNGTILLTGNPEYEYEKQIVQEIKNWTDVKDIIVPSGWSFDGHIVALRNDGTVIAAGDNSAGQCDFTYPTPHNEENNSENTVVPADSGEEESTGEQTLLREGTCGSNLSWFLDEEGQLTINGTGSMESTPWDLLRSQIISIKIEGADNVGPGAFFGCPNLSKVELSESVKRIEYRAFMECTNLIEVNLPRSLEKIESEAFRHCVRLKEIRFPETLESIGRMAFQGCEGLGRIIMTGDTKLAYNAGADYSGYCDVFEGCIGLTSAGPIGSGCDFEFAWTDAIGGLTNCRNLSKVILPEAVTVIPDRAFYGCKNLESIHIPDGVTEIGAGAFAKCTSLADIRLPQSVTLIGDYAFYSCIGLKEIEIPDATNEIGVGAFMGCVSLEKIFMPEHLDDMGWGVFENCNSLSEIVIPEGVSTILGYTFEGCTNLQSITLPESLNDIIETAFMDCINLRYVISYGVKQWGIWKFDSMTDCLSERCGYFDAAERIILPVDD